VNSPGCCNLRTQASAMVLSFLVTLCIPPERELSAPGGDLVPGTRIIEDGLGGVVRAMAVSDGVQSETGVQKVSQTATPLWGFFG